MAPRTMLAAALLMTSYLAGPTTAMISSGRPGYGFIGYGIKMYDPPCAYGCQGSFGNPLLCSDDGSHSDEMGDMDMKARDIVLWKLEQWWQLNVAGRSVVQPVPKYSYQEALDQVVAPPNATTPSDEPLTGVSLADEETYLATYNGDYTFELSDAKSARYGIVVLVTECAIPIGLSFLRFAPFPRAFVSRFNARFVDPPLFGSRHRVPLMNTAFVPTRGQSFFIAYIILINVILSAAGYRMSWPNSWWTNNSQQVVEYIANRTGVLSLANLAVLTLYAGRNNFLLWMTNWSQSTFLLLHRWVAVICVLQACIHSALYLQMYTHNGNDYAAESKLSYWYWGIISTLAMVVVLPMSMLQFRQKLYEAFLAAHFMLALLAGVAYYYHIVYRFQRQWGYETWIYIFFGIWAFDRLIRVIKMARHGLRIARVTIIDEDYVQLSVRDVSASGHAYLYFPTLTWRVWENHPFSVATSLLSAAAPVSQEHLSGNRTLEKSLEATTVALDNGSKSGSQRSATTTPRSQHHDLGLTFFVRTHTGTTKLLRARKAVPVLVEACYGGSHSSGLSGSDLGSYARLLCIAGGVGITAIMPVVSDHHGSRVVYWGARSQALVDAVHSTWDTALTGVDLNVVVGERLDVETILEQELRNETHVQTSIAVVVSGPASLADAVRIAVARHARMADAAVITFVEESYSW
ncbi:hypothetical protein LTR56_005982 [Elasticomyces elasticus]|nr:hypothetical protein LTR56_005982 [Elasticomyces elasticus]KAK4922644.1 hypothetical protein LTR49_010000 [Elasticomyces elasticus]KAK5760899.1 hypothetical protein LTS12_008903 [Elasticomyces elasticus]